MQGKFPPASACLPHDASGHTWHHADDLLFEIVKDGPAAVIGDDGSLIWRDLVPFERLPFLLHPPSGYVVSANATPFRGTSPEHDLHASNYVEFVGIETGVTKRIERATELIEAHGKGATLTRAQVDAASIRRWASSCACAAAESTCR